MKCAGVVDNFHFIFKCPCKNKEQIKNTSWKGNKAKTNKLTRLQLGKQVTHKPRFIHTNSNGTAKNIANFIVFYGRHFWGQVVFKTSTKLSAVSFNHITIKSVT